MIRVLLVEDEAIIRRLIACTTDWTSLGCTLAGEAENGAQGLEMIRTLAPQLVISDIRMPEMDGIEMLRRGRQEARFESILLTGYAEFSYARDAISLGAVDYILKPIDENRLYEAIGRAVARILEHEEYLTLKDGAKHAPMQTFDQTLSACTDPYVRRALRDMNERFREHLSVEALAERLNISAGYLARRFKAETGMTFGTALQRLRVQKAVSLMDSGMLRIYEIAEEVGYSNYKRFCEVFKQTTGHTPTEYAAFLGRFEDKKSDDPEESL